jgi:hypothetical protein
MVKIPMIEAPIHPLAMFTRKSEIIDLITSVFTNVMIRTKSGKTLFKQKVPGERVGLSTLAL